MTVMDHDIFGARGEETGEGAIDGAVVEQSAPAPFMRRCSTGESNAVSFKTIATSKGGWLRAPQDIGAPTKNWSFPT